MHTGTYWLLTRAALLLISTRACVTSRWRRSIVFTCVRCTVWANTDSEGLSYNETEIRWSGIVFSHMHIDVDSVISGS